MNIDFSLNSIRLSTLKFFLAYLTHPLWPWVGKRADKALTKGANSLVIGGVESSFGWVGILAFSYLFDPQLKLRGRISCEKDAKSNTALEEHYRISKMSYISIRNSA